MTNSRHPTLQVLALPAVRIFLLARFSMLFGRALIAAMLSYHLFAITDSYAALGLLGLVEFLPVIPVSLLGGALADRFDRKRLLMLTASGSLLGAAFLTYLSVHSPESVTGLLCAAFGLAAINSISRPAGSALLPNLVPRNIFQNASVVSSSVVQSAFISGPIAMGFLMALYGFEAPYGLAVFFYALTLLFLFLLSVPPGHKKEGDISWGSIREGISFVWNHQAILGSITLDMLAVIFAGATALLPVYADEILKVGPEGYGFLRAAMAVGTLSMALILMTRKPFHRPGRALLVAVLLFGVATIVFGLSRSMTLSILAFIVAGMADQVSMTARSVILQLSTPDSLRGRVSAVNFIFIGASNELGDAESGFLASLTSATFSVVSGGVVCLGVLGWVAARMPELRNYQPEAAGSPNLE
ncbi:MAG: MFS transporter [Myxococcota bacterium]|nr:MFS transporter [Myxococcota bacterium]